mmetsp:Transcript_60010/g.142638  ORF Transcript_60010/g.142638 Transcript_60010/m.142638 type:complete len:212 (-) Transcript_60010:252-887(-)
MFPRTKRLLLGREAVGGEFAAGHEVLVDAECGERLHVGCRPPEFVDGDDLELDLLALLEHARAPPVDLRDLRPLHLDAVQEEADHLVAPARRGIHPQVGPLVRHVRKIQQILLLHHDAGLLLELLGGDPDEVARVVEHACGELREVVLACRHARLHRQYRVLFLVLLAGDEHEDAHGVASHENNARDLGALLVLNVRRELDEAHARPEHVH